MLNLGSAPLPIRKYGFLPVPHIYGSFMLSVTCITDSRPLFADLEFFIQRSSWLGIAYSSSKLNLQINGQGEPSKFPVSAEQAKMSKASNSFRGFVAIYVLMTINHAVGDCFAR